MNKKTIYIAFGIVLSLALVIFLFVPKSTSKPQEKTETNALEDTVREKEDVQREPSTTIDIEGRNFSFSPNKVTVKKGSDVKIKFTSKDGIHSFAIEGLNVSAKSVPTGNSDLVEFRAPETPGEYEFYCSVGNHRKLGMVGVLIVE